jgi:hypothetical protein
MGSESKRIGWFICGAHPNIRANMRTIKPRTIQKTTDLLSELTEELIQTKGSKGNDSGFRGSLSGTGSRRKGTSSRRKGTSSPREVKVTLLVVTRQEGLKEKVTETRLHVSIVIEYIMGNVSISLVIRVDERGMPHAIVGSRLFVTHAELKAISRPIVQVSTIPPLLIKGKEQVPPKTTHGCS